MKLNPIRSRIRINEKWELSWDCVIVKKIIDKLVDERGNKGKHFTMLGEI